MRVYRVSRRQLFNQIERSALKPLPTTRFVYGEWTRAKVAVDAGVTSHAVAAALGHESFKTTAASYAKRVAVADAKHKKAIAALMGGGNNEGSAAGGRAPKVLPKYARTGSFPVRAYFVDTETGQCQYSRTGKSDGQAHSERELTPVRENEHCG